MGYVNLILKFLRLGPLGLGVIAIAILAGGYFLQVEMNKTAAAEARALAAGPPKPVDIARFDRDRDMSSVREVMVQAQPVLDFAYRLTIEQKGTDDHVFMVPLVAADAISETDILGIAYFTSPNEDFDNITPELLMRGMSSFGTVGPVITYNGKLRSMGSWDDLTEEAFFDEGLAMPANPVVVWPYMEGREVALAPAEVGDLTAFGLLSKLAGAIGLLALAKIAFKPSKPSPAASPFGVEYEGETHAQPSPQPQFSAATLRKQRSGLIEGVDFEQSVADYEPEPEPMMSFSDEEALMPAAKKRMSVRKILIGLVGGLFALGLVSTIGELVGDSSSAQTVSIPSPEERVADAVADAIVPDAPSDRHWTEIDVSPAIEWVTAQALLAASGDTDAMINLGMIAAGLLALMFLPWWFFRMRRKLGPRTTARFDSMGIN